MSDKPISPLRRRMIEDMTVRNFVEETRNNYIRHVRTFTAFLGRTPDTALPRSHLPHQPNPHSAVRGILRAPSPAGSFLGGFRTPATGGCRGDVGGRHPKPSTKAEVARLVAGE